MREVELKSVVEDVYGCRERLERAGAALVFAGRLEDRRFDRPDRGLAAIDHVLRLRVYRSAAGARAELGWKGPTTSEEGYKVREELGTAIDDDAALSAMLGRLGYIVTRAIDREITQYELNGTIVRFERYPRMDTLVEVEGTPHGIERAITVLELPREGFSADRLPAFARRYRARTGLDPVICDAELDGPTIYPLDDA